MKINYSLCIAAALWSLFSTTMSVFGQSDNTQFGTGALNGATGSYNAAFGYEAIYSSTSGNGNSAIGFQALYTNSTGSNNTASGLQSLFSNTSGSENTATGEASLYFNTS